MDDAARKQIFREEMKKIGQKGGEARAKSLTKEERLKSAHKAAAAAARVHKAKARKKPKV